MPDQLATLQTLLKWAERIEHPTQAPHLVARAFQEMVSGRRGPVALEMPWDQFTATAEVTPQEPLPLHRIPCPIRKRSRAGELLIEAKAPMIWVGGGAVMRRRRSWRWPKRSARPSCPSAAAAASSTTAIRWRSTFGGFELWPKTDLLIAFGTRMEVPTGRWGRPGRNKDGPHRHRPARFAHEGRIVNVADTADAAAHWRCRARNDPARAPPRRGQGRDACRNPAGPAAMSFWRDPRGAAGKWHLCDEMTQVGYVSWFGFPFHPPRSLITSGFSGTLGAGFPTALGVKVAMPDRPVVS